MENASNALKIAAGVIMAMLILSLLVYGIVRLRNYQNAVDDSKQIEQANKFNQRFESYNKQIVTGYTMEKKDIKL
jgi:high-affinity Fe2+/Pb2+ permease